jgi:hypothetical protein
VLCFACDVLGIYSTTSMGMGMVKIRVGDYVPVRT